jgi:hypothetical protein
MDGDLLGADELGKVHPAFTDGKSTARLTLGSIETQMFLRIESVVSKPFRSATGAWMAEVDRAERGTHMHEILALLTDEEAFRVLAAIRMDQDPKSPQEKWCLLMHTRGNGTGQRDLGGPVLKERHITSPSKRNKFGNKHRSPRLGTDEGDIRFFEMERSQSRDRNDGTTAPISTTSYVSPAFQRYDPPSYYQRSGRPMSLLNNPTLGTPTQSEGSSLKPSGISTISQGTRSQSTAVCSSHLRGDCRFGSRCRFKHPVGVGLESTTPTNDQK